MSIEVRAPERFLHIARAKSSTGIPLRERLSQTLEANSGWSKTNCSFQIRAPGGSNSLLDSHIRLTFPMELFIKGKVNEVDKQTLYERSSGLLMAMDAISISFNGQTRAMRPRRDGLVQMADAFQRICRKDMDYSNLAISSDHYPSSHICSSFAITSEKNKFDLSLVKEPFVEQKVRKFQSYTANNQLYTRVEFSCYLPLSPFEGVFDDLKRQCGMDVSRATPHCNLVDIEIQWNKNPLQYLLQQNPSTAKKFTGLTSTMLDLGALWAHAQTSQTAAEQVNTEGVITGGEVRLYAPELHLDWWSVPSTIQIPPQVSCPAIQYDVHTQEVSSTAATGYSTKIEWRNIKFESLPKLLVAFVTAGDADFDLDQAMMDYDFAEIDYSSLKVVASTKTSILNQPSKKLIYETYRRYCHPGVCISEFDFFRSKSMIVIDDAIFCGDPSQMYSPFTLNMSFTTKRISKWPASDSTARTAQAYLVGLNPAAFNISENAASLSALRFSRQAVNAAMGRPAEKE